MFSILNNNTTKQEIENKKTTILPNLIGKVNDNKFILNNTNTKKINKNNSQLIFRLINLKIIYIGKTS